MLKFFRCWLRDIVTWHRKNLPNNKAEWNKSKINSFSSSNYWCAISLDYREYSRRIIRISSILFSQIVNHHTVILSHQTCMFDISKYSLDQYHSPLRSNKKYPTHYIRTTFVFFSSCLHHQIAHHIQIRIFLAKRERKNSAVFSAW